MEMHPVQRTRYSPAQELMAKMYDRRRQLQYASIPILFQMKLMKVNCKTKNMMNKEFEHDEEL
jgi:hypothetical protein